MFPHVYMDIGLGVNHTGVQSEQLIAEMLEVAPFRKILFSSDAWGLPELHLLGSWLFRRGLSRVLGRWVVAGDWSLGDAAAGHRPHRLGRTRSGSTVADVRERRPQPQGRSRWSRVRAARAGRSRPRLAACAIVALWSSDGSNMARPSKEDPG